MFVFENVFNLASYLTALLALVAIVGDYVVVHSQLHIFKALFDNATHSIIGGLSWFIVCVNYKNYHYVQTLLLEVAVCALIASLIDLDHFVAARSLNLKDATNLKQRPLLHYSTFPLLICFATLLLSVILQINSLKRFTLIVLVAFASHHTRDATRRGYWFYPYWSTPPVPYAVYVVLTCIIPYVVSRLQEFISIRNGSFKHGQFSVI